LFLFVPRARALRALDAELLKTILERSEGKAEELRGLCYVVVGSLHGLHDEVALHVLEVDALGGKLEARALRGRSRLKSHFERQVFGGDVVGLSEKNRALD